MNNKILKAKFFKEYEKGQGNSNFLNMRLSHDDE